MILQIKENDYISAHILVKVGKYKGSVKYLV